MIYLTFDTNIFIYSLDGSWQFDDNLDTIEAWIEEKHVKLLLPDIIAEEWNRHRAKQSEVRRDKLKDFFKIAVEILPPAFLSEFTSEAAQGRIVEAQVDRIINLVNSAGRVPVNDIIRDQVLARGISKLAPMANGKNNTADALIAESLIYFASKNPEHKYYFVSENTSDFCVKEGGKHEVHPDLRIQFEANKIFYRRHVNTLIAELKLQGLPEPDLKEKRKQRIRNRLTQRAYNPEYETLVQGQSTSFLQNMETIEFILGSANPTREQTIYVFALIDSDAAYEREFYQKLKNPAWFPILKQKGAFKIETIPGAVKSEIGYQFPYWLPMIYLATLVEEMDQHKRYDLGGEIIGILTSATGKIEVNWRISISILQILKAFPTERVPLKFLDLIPKWFTGTFDRSHHTRELSGHILPKFLNEHSTSEDLEKAKAILNHLLGVIHLAQPTAEESYISLFDLRALKRSLDPVIISQIITRFGLTFVEYTAHSLKLLFTYFPNGLMTTLRVDKGEYNINARKDGRDLNLHLTPPGSQTSFRKVKEYESLSQDELNDVIQSSIHETGTIIEWDSDNLNLIKRISFNLLNDVRFSYFNREIKKLDEYSQYQKQPSIHLAAIFRDLVRSAVLQLGDIGIGLLNRLLNDRQFQMPFFKKLALMIINENWGVFNECWWSFAKSSPDVFKTNHILRHDIFDLLYGNRNDLTNINIQFLENPSPAMTDDELDGWRLRLYSRLKDIADFKEKYEALARKMGLTPRDLYPSDNVDQSDELFTEHVSKAEMLKSSIPSIAKKIQEFRPDGKFDRISVDSLARVLGEAITEQPERFVVELEAFSDIQYPYLYYIINGFTDAWKTKRGFDWRALLNYCVDNIQRERFGGEELYVDKYDDRSHPDWILGALGDLITAGVRSDSHAFPVELIPVAIELLHIAKNKMRQEVYEERSDDTVDYPMKAVNSPTGKLLRAAIELSLRSARTGNAQPKWNPDLKRLYEDLVSIGPVYSEVLKGMYFEPFLYLDRDWIVEQTRKLLNEREENLRAFLGGLEMSNAPGDKEIYEVLAPIYIRYIERGYSIASHHDDGLVRHFVSFYFWEYDTHVEDSLVYRVIEQGNLVSIRSIVNFISRHGDYGRSLEPDEQISFEKRIVSLWNFLIDEYTGQEGKEEKAIMSDLIWFTTFLSALSKSATDLIIKSPLAEEEFFDLGEWLNDLHRLKQIGSPDETAQHLGRIVSVIPVNHYLNDAEMEGISGLIIFLYENSQAAAANTFCDRYRRNQITFLDTIYRKYNG